MNVPKTGNWWLRFLALALAIVIYHALKTESEANGRPHERRLFQTQPE